jgi:hypothetical protein
VGGEEKRERFWRERRGEGGGGYNYLGCGSIERREIDCINRIGVTGIERDVAGWMRTTTSSHRVPCLNSLSRYRTTSEYISWRARSGVDLENDDCKHLFKQTSCRTQPSTSSSPLLPSP